jgi:hypothetical protein
MGLRQLALGTIAVCCLLPSIGYSTEHEFKLATHLMTDWEKVHGAFYKNVSESEQETINIIVKRIQQLGPGDFAGGVREVFSDYLNGLSREKQTAIFVEAMKKLEERAPTPSQKRNQIFALFRRYQTDRESFLSVREAGLSSGKLPDFRGLLSRPKK